MSSADKQKILKDSIERIAPEKDVQKIILENL